MANLMGMIRPERPNAAPRAPLKATPLSAQSPTNTSGGKRVAKPKKSPQLDAERGLAPRSCEPTNQNSGTPKPGPRKAAKVRTGSKIPKRLTEGRLNNIADFYLSQREASEGMLRAVLVRRLRRRLPHAKNPAQEEAEAMEAIETIVEKFAKAGVIDNARFAEMKARSGLTRGRGARRIATELTQKGIEGEAARAAIVSAARERLGVDADGMDDEDALREAEFASAEDFALKKRIGRHRVKPLPEDYAGRQKEWAREARKMASAGFGFDVIRQVLDQDPELE